MCFSVNASTQANTAGRAIAEEERFAIIRMQCTVFAGFHQATTTIQKTNMVEIQVKYTKQGPKYSWVGRAIATKNGLQANVICIPHICHMFYTSTF